PTRFHEEPIFTDAYGKYDKQIREDMADRIVDSDSKQISWSRALKQELVRGRIIEFDPKCLTPSLYRPYTKLWQYYNRRLNDMILRMPSIFPSETADNRAIMVKQRWTGDGQLALMVDRVVELQTDGGTQCFPLYLYD